VCEGLILENNFPNGYHCTNKTKLQHFKHFHSILMLQKLVYPHLWHDLGLKNWCNNLAFHKDQHLVANISIWWYFLWFGDQYIIWVGDSLIKNLVINHLIWWLINGSLYLIVNYIVTTACLQKHNSFKVYIFVWDLQIRSKVTFDRILEFPWVVVLQTDKTKTL